MCSCITTRLLDGGWVLLKLAPVTESLVLSYCRQDGVKAAKRSIQMEIQTAVHKIYQQLSVTLERALQANKHHIGRDTKG